MVSIEPLILTCFESVISIVVFVAPLESLITIVPVPALIAPEKLMVIAVCTVPAASPFPVNVSDDFDTVIGVGFEARASPTEDSVTTTDFFAGVKASAIVEFGDTVFAVDASVVDDSTSVDCV